MASGDHIFKTIKDQSGKIIKLKAPISNYKDITVNSFNDRPYAHISDVSKCFKKGGTFDITRARSVTLNKEEVQTFISMTDRLSTAMDTITVDSNATDSDSDPRDGDDGEKSGTNKNKKPNKRRVLSP